MKANKTRRLVFGLILALFGGFSPLYGADVRTTRLEVNLIVDGSAAISGVLEEVTAWISGNLLDQRLQEGDRITVWSAGGTAKIVYSDTLKGGEAKETVKKALQGLPAAGSAADFSGALRDAASRSSGTSYTMLISASAAALSPTLLGPQAGLLRFSRVQEFRGWRAMVIGLNIDSRVRQAAAAWLAGA
jgi:hypothetical protein